MNAKSEPTAAQKALVGLSALALANCATSTDTHAVASAPAGAAPHLQVARAGSQPQTTGAAANFTGHVVITPLFQATEHTRAAGASVTFDPSARTAWHTHPAGQTLIVTAGTGWVQEWGGVKHEIHPGDVIWTPPGVKHWHGATLSSGMTHIAVQENVDGKVVDWLEHVTDEEYQR